MAGILLLGALTGGWFFLQARYNDDALAKSLVRQFNLTHQGRITIERVHWGPHAIWALITGGDTEIQIDDVRIYDPRGELVARVPSALARLDVRTLLLDGHLVISRVRAKGGYVRLEPMEPARPRFGKRAGKKAPGATAAKADGNRDPEQRGSPRFGLLSALALREGIPEFLTAPSGEPSLTLVDDIRVTGLKVEARMPSAELRAHLPRMALTGAVHHVSDGEGGQILRLRLGLLTPEPGWIRARGERVALHALEVWRLETRGSDLEFAVALRAGQDQAALLTWGRVRDLLDPKETARLAVRLRVERFGRLAGRLLGQPLQDRGSLLEAHLVGPLSWPMGRLRLSGLAYAHPRARPELQQLRVVAGHDDLRLSDLQVAVAGGTLQARGRLDRESGRFAALLRGHGLNLPPQKATAAEPTPVPQGHGALLARARGQITEPRWVSGWVQVRLRPGPGRSWPAPVGAYAQVSYDESRLSLGHLKVRTRGLRLSARGELDPRSERLRARLDLRGRGLRRWLRAFGLPPVAGGLRLQARARGKWWNPTADASLRASGLPAGPLGSVALRARAHLSGGRVTLERLAGSIGGGDLLAQGHAELYPGDLRADRTPPRYRLQGRLRGLSLTRLGLDDVSGELSAWFRVRGRGGQPRGRVRVEGKRLTLAGEAWRGLHLKARLRPSGAEIRRLEIRRVAGGRLRVKGHVRRSGRVDLNVSVARLPLQSLPGLEGLEPKVAGSLAIPELRVRGPIQAPTLDGSLQVEGLALGGEPLGSARLRFLPSGRRTAIQGRLARGVRVVSARVDPRSRRARVHLKLSGIDLVRYLPDLEKRGVVSTEVGADVRARLRLSPLRIRVDVQGHQLAATLRTPPRQAPAWSQRQRDRASYTWRAVDGYRLRWTDGRLRLSRLTLQDDLRYRRVSIRGWLQGDRHRLRVEGNLSLLPLSPLLGHRIAHLQGTLGLDVTSQGKLTEPDIVGTLLPAGVKVRLPDTSASVVIPAGRIELQRKRWKLSDLRLYVGSSHLALGGELEVDHGLPQALDLQVHGTVRPELLEMVPGRVVRSAHGEPWTVDVQIQGTPSSPQVTGEVKLARTTIETYALPYLLELRGGSAELSGSRIELSQVRGRLGGAPFRLGGKLWLGTGGLDRLSLHLRGEAIPVRAGDALRVELSPDLTVRGKIGEGGALAVGGRITVVGGRYGRDFEINPTSLLLSQKRVEETRPPLWERIPWLGRTRLSVNVVVQRFRVDNNVAELKLMGDLSLQGRLSNLEIHGGVEALGGTFQIPLLRGRYTLVVGRVDFDRGRAAGRDDPWVYLRGVTPVHGRGKEHRVTLQVKGLLSQLQPEWWTDTGLRQQEILALLAGVNAADALGAGGIGLKTLAPLVGETLPGELQMEMGVQAVGLSYEQRLGPMVRLRGGVSFGYAGQQRQVGEVIVRLHDRITLSGRALRRVVEQEVTEENDTLEGQALLRYRIELRGGLRRALGF